MSSLGQPNGYAPQNQFAPPSGFGHHTGNGPSGSGNNPVHTAQAQAMFVSSDSMGYYGSPPSYGDYALSTTSAPCYFSQSNQGQSQSPTPWFFDSGATSHVTQDSSQIKVSNESIGPSSVTVGNGQSVPVAHSGQNHTPNSAPRDLSQGALPPASFL